MASIIDVARLAKVSVSTASRVLSGNPYPVSKEKRVRVLEAARTLNYMPNVLAQAMVTGDTHIVGIIVGDSTDPYFATIVRGAEDIARKHGYLAIICNSDRVPEIELHYLRTLNSYQVEGVIFAGGGLKDEGYLSEMRQTLEVLYARGGACVTMGKHLFPSLQVMVDNEKVVISAVDYLVGLGHTRIAYISGPELLTTTELRLRGYQQALEKHGLQFDPKLVISGDYKFDSGLKATHVVHQLSPPPTAVLASNDMMAIGCLAGLKELGYKIPEEISVMGIDDIPIAQITDPPLTTIAIPLYDLGAVGMETLIKVRNREVSVDTPIILPHRLVVRKSTASPRNKTC